MAENILILGNGFDLAMGRKTSYGDFLKFARQIKVLGCHILQHYNAKDIQEAFSAFIDDIDKLWENHEYDETKQSEEEQNFYNKLKADQKFLLISEHIFEKLAILKDDCITLVALNSLNSGATKRYLLNQIREELKNDTSISNRFFNIDCVLELTKSSENRNIEWLLELPNNLYINYIEEYKDKLGKNWSGIELAISDIAEGIQVIKHNLNQIPNLLGPNAELTLRDEDNYVAIKYIYFIMRQKFGGYSSIVRSKVLDNINDDFIKALDDLTSYLEFYLTYLDKVDFEMQKISPASTVLDAIQNIENSKVITFNYTNTASEILGVTEDNTHFVHGKCSFERSDDDINTMVFGIEDKEAEAENINQDLIPYQKFYQRVVKETGNFYEKFWGSSHDGGDFYTQSTALNIVVFGHSVDPLDKEIFKKCFELSEIKGWDYRFIFTYYNLDAKRAIVRNLAIILGKSELVRLTGEERIKFVQSNNTEQMRKELLN
ncbi:AbiH family protein [Streptococcus suis]|uniref:AbiH family protein n=1 Tax=Streptococcus suis TaxID=1307 RepID=UPI000CF45DB8|nr:AbiH family protein [Streptococcus suis]